MKLMVWRGLDTEYTIRGDIYPVLGEEGDMALFVNAFGQEDMADISLFSEAMESALVLQ